MRNHILALLSAFSFFFFQTHAAITSSYPSGDNVVEETLQLGLPVMVITTDSGENPTCDYIDPPEGCMGGGITNAVKLPGSVIIYNPDGSLAYESGPYEKKKSGMTIKVRGNTSAYLEKKPYKIKLEKKADLLCREDGCKDKNWVLLYDLRLAHWVGQQFSKSIEMTWTPQSRLINVVLNGSYHGLYLLSESVERNPDGRLDCDDTGFIVEKDPYWWNEDGEYLPSVYHPRYNYTMKFPDFEDMDEECKEYIETTMRSFDNALAEGTPELFADVESMARWCLAHDIVGTNDGGGVNMYFLRYDNLPESLLYMPCLWDLDSMEWARGEWSGVHIDYFSHLFSSNSAFLRCYINLWDEIKDSIFSYMASLAEDLRTESWNEFNASVKASRKRWPGLVHNLSTETAHDIEYWFPSRKIWMEEQINSLRQFTGIDTPVIDTPVLNCELDGLRLRVSVFAATCSFCDNSEISVFNSMGMKIGSSRSDLILTLPSKGIYIVTCGSAVRKIVAY